MSAVVRILPSGHEFVVEANEPLLQAAPLDTTELKLTVRESLGTVADPKFVEVEVAEELIVRAPSDRSIPATN